MIGSATINQNIISQNSSIIGFPDDFAVSIWGEYSGREHSDSAEVYENTFIDSGIEIGGNLKNLIIANNVFKDLQMRMDKYAISIRNTSGNRVEAIIRGNIFSNFFYNDRGAFGGAIKISGTGDAHNGGIIENNTFKNINGDGIRLSGTGNAVISSTIQNNRFDNCGKGPRPDCAAIRVG